MRLNSRIGGAVAVVAVALASAAGSGPALASAGQTTGHATRALVHGRAGQTAVPGGATLWIHRFDGGNRRIASGTSVAVSPDGTTVFVAGTSARAGSFGADEHLLTVAYNASTGARLWTASYAGGSQHPEGTTFLAVSPDGSTLYVGAGLPPPGAPRLRDYLTVSYNTATGAQNWVTTTPAEHQAADQGLVLSPDGSTLYLTGLGAGSTRGVAYETVALTAATGSQIWESNYGLKRQGLAYASYIAASPNGAEVFVVGEAGMVAYDAATGTQLWVDHYKVELGGRFRTLAVSPDSSTVYATGNKIKHLKNGGVEDAGYETVAYNTSTGATIWQVGVKGKAGERAESVAVSPDGSTVFITGDLVDLIATTIAYDAATGTQLWRSRYSTKEGGGVTADLVTASPAGSAVYVLASVLTAADQYGYLVIAYNAATGAQLWKSQLTGPGSDPDSPVAITSSADGVYATGNTEKPPSGEGQDLMTTLALQP